MYWGREKLTLVVLVLLIIISPSNVLKNEVAKLRNHDNHKPESRRDIIANSNPFGNTDVNTPFNAIRVHVYSDYVISF